MLEDKHIQTMQDYGLSFLQAKTYLILLMLGEADTKTIAKESNVARQEIYRVMPSLQKLGLGKKTIGKPIMYKATPLDEALSILLNKEKEEIAELEKKRSWLLKNIRQGTPKKSVDADETQFTVISELTLFVNSQKKLLAKTQESIDIIVPIIPCPPRFREIWRQLEETLKIKNNLKVRLIAQGNIESLSRTFMNYPGFEWRISSERIYFGMNIFDEKELTVAIDEKTGLPSLWSNNPNIVTIAKNYYALMWEKTTKTVSKKA